MLDRDATVGEPINGPTQDSDSGEGGLVVVDLGVGDAAVVVDQGRPDTRGSSGLGEQTAESAADRTADSSAT